VVSYSDRRMVHVSVVVLIELLCISLSRRVLFLWNSSEESTPKWIFFVASLCQSADSGYSKPQRHYV